MTMNTSDNWTFFQAFLKSPRTIASVIPSSSFVERRVVAAADLATARVVVELGGGTGGITRSLLKAMGPESQLLVIERTEQFVRSLARIDDPRLHVVHGCASSIVAELAARGYAQADAVISGIPFSTLPKALAAEIVAGVHTALAPGGRFVAYQFKDRVADYVRPLMGAPVVEHELCNVPPVRVFTWRKASQNGRPPAAG
jgi:phospholipid N-methyltransferase